MLVCCMFSHRLWASTLLSGHRCHRLSSILIPNASNVVWRFTLLWLALIFAFCRGPREGRRWLLSGRGLLDFFPDAACRELHREWANTQKHSQKQGRASSEEEIPSYPGASDTFADKTRPLLGTRITVLQDLTINSHLYSMQCRVHPSFVLQGYHACLGLGCFLSKIRMKVKMKTEYYMYKIIHCKACKALVNTRIYWNNSGDFHPKLLSWKD